MRFFLGLAYNGTNYRGWQRQPDAPSVQQTVEEALSKLLGEQIEVTGAGRTDTGVHAAYYVAHFDIGERGGSGEDGENRDDGTVSEELGADFLYHANSILPADIALKSVTRVADDAHARFNAIEREYIYYILPVKDPFRTDTAWHYSVPLDIGAMNRAAEYLTEASDFTSFAKLGGGNKTNICRVMSARWDASEGAIRFTIRADRFLRNMVRAIVGTLVDVGRGKLTPERFGEIVAAKDLRLSSGGAPAHGLFLTDITYTNQKPK